MGFEPSFRREQGKTLEIILSIIPITIYGEERNSFFLHACRSWWGNSLPKRLIGRKDKPKLYTYKIA